jgi:hypothetical protein
MELNLPQIFVRELPTTNLLLQLMLLLGTLVSTPLLVVVRLMWPPAIVLSVGRAVRLLCPSAGMLPVDRTGGGRGLGGGCLYVVGEDGSWTRQSCRA